MRASDLPAKACYEMPEHTFTELDSLTDWAVMEGLARQYGYQKVHSDTVN